MGVGGVKVGFRVQAESVDWQADPFNLRVFCPYQNKPDASTTELTFQPAISFHWQAVLDLRSEI